MVECLAADDIAKVRRSCIAVDGICNRTSLHIPPSRRLEQIIDSICSFWINVVEEVSCVDEGEEGGGVRGCVLSV